MGNPQYVLSFYIYKFFIAICISVKYIQEITKIVVNFRSGIFMIFDIFLCQIWTSLISYAVCQIFLANNFVLKVKNKEKKRMVAKTGR